MLMIKTALFTGIFAATALAAVDPVVVTINNRAIHLDEFTKRYDDAKKLLNPPSNKKAFLEDLVRYEVGVQEAEHKNIAKDPIIAERIRQQLYVGLIEKELSSKINDIKISDSEMREYYKSSPEIKSSHILIEIKPNATEAERATAKKRAEEILSEVKSSKRPFEELVNLYTDDLSTKKRGGDIGYQTRISIVAPYYDAVSKMKVGDISGLIESKYGFHIAKLTGKHSFEESDKGQIKAALFERKRLALFNDYFDKLKKKYKITTNSDIVK